MENQSLDFSSSPEPSSNDDPEPPSPNIESLNLDAMRIREMATLAFETLKNGDRREHIRIKQEMRMYQSHLLAHEVFVKENIHIINPADAEVINDEIWLAKRCK